MYFGDLRGFTILGICFHPDMLQTIQDMSGGNQPIGVVVLYYVSSCDCTEGFVPSPKFDLPYLGD